MTLLESFESFIATPDNFERIDDLLQDRHPGSATALPEASQSTALPMAHVEVNREQCRDTQSGQHA
jgi:hypothetical protein